MSNTAEDPDRYHLVLISADGVDTRPEVDRIIREHLDKRWGVWLARRGDQEPSTLYRDAVTSNWNVTPGQVWLSSNAREVLESTANQVAGAVLADPLATSAMFGTPELVVLDDVDPAHLFDQVWAESDPATGDLSRVLAHGESCGFRILFALTAAELGNLSPVLRGSLVRYAEIRWFDRGPDGATHARPGSITV